MSNITTTASAKTPIQRSAEETENFLLENKNNIVYKSRFLTSHTRRNEDTNHINHKIHYLLHDPHTFVLATCKNKGVLTKGVKEDEEASAFFGLEQATAIAKQFKTQTYSFRPGRRTWIPKPGKTAKRPLDTPTQQDRIAQEAIRGILEAIYEPEFRQFADQTNSLATNFGFRPKLSTWHAVNQLKTFGQGTSQIIEGDISKAYNTVNHDKLLSILNRRIKDQRFLRMIKMLLENGIMDDGRLEHSLEGVPQGGILSPLLFNIYMFEFDKFVYKTIVSPVMSQVSKPRKSKQWQRLGYAMKKSLIKWQESPKDKAAYDEYYKPFKEMEKERLGLPSYEISSLAKRALFVRYADDWILAFTGTNYQAQLHKEKMSKFLREELFLSLSEEKTLITHIQDGVNFLGFRIAMTKPNQNKYHKELVFNNSAIKFARITRRSMTRKIHIYPDHDRIWKNLTLGGFCTKRDLFPIGIRSWCQFDEYEIVLKYRRIMVGLTNYYRNCDNVYSLNRVSYILQYSCAKTIATRQKITMSQVFLKYGTNLEIKRTLKTAKNEKTTTTTFPTLSQLRKEGRLEYKERNKLDYDPFKIHNYWRTKAKIYNNCCICGSDDRVALHHINSLRSIKPQKRDRYEYIRSQINRIQIPVCFPCHLDITHGKYDKDTTPIQFYDKFLATL